jgi:nucleoid DNA-binding protein
MSEPTRPCSEEALASRLVSGEGLPGLREWIGQLRGAIVRGRDDEEYSTVAVAGLGSFASRPRRGVRALTFTARQTLKNLANGHEPDEPGECDEVVAAIYAAIADGHDAVQLPGIGSLRIERMEAYTGPDLRGGTVDHDEKKLIKFAFDHELVADVAAE